MTGHTAKRGILAVVSGFSGAGKGTAMKRLMETKNGYALSISVTTRSPRPGEEDGREYFFRTREQFEEMISKEELIEYAEYVGNYYGTPRAYVEQQLSSGKDVILEIETRGASNVKKKFPEAVLLFITAPGMDALAQRLRGRGTESEEIIAGRLAQAAREAKLIPDYDYLVVNRENEIDDCVERIHSIIQCEKERTIRSAAFMQELIRDSGKYLKNVTIQDV